MANVVSVTYQYQNDKTIITFKRSFIDAIVSKLLGVSVSEFDALNRWSETEQHTHALSGVVNILITRNKDLIVKGVY